MQNAKIKIKEEMSQVVVMKGWQGFADRLQLLSHLLSYCKTNDAAICLDWRDKIWGQGEEDFSDYFEILGIPTITLQKTVEMAKRGAKIFPDAWTIDLLEGVPTFDTYSDDYKLTLTEKNERIEGDILITNAKGLRQWSSKILTQHLRFTKPVAQEIIELIKEIKKPYCVVHLRGTDRSVDGLFDMYVENYEKISKEKKETVYLISDSPEYVEKWMALYPATQTIIKNPPVLALPRSGRGTHVLEKDKLMEAGITKHQLNINLLADFMIFAFSNSNVGFSESAFVTMARLLSKIGKVVLGEWLHGWCPDN